MRIVAIGEGMLELSGDFGGAARLAYGGDTLNTAVYLARLGCAPAYLTALGLDPWSQDMRLAWEREGIRTHLVLTSPTRLPGLYAIRTDAAGERSFHYWRAQSAARELFGLPGLDAALAEAAGCDLLYLSGITLSLYEGADRERLFDLAGRVRAGGGQVAFDPNYRPRGWASPEAAREAFSRMARLATLALPTFDDEAALHGDADPLATARRWGEAGVGEVVVKRGGEGASVFVQGERHDVPAVRGVPVVDTTGAGDSFNGAYLAHRLRGARPAMAAGQANRLAAVVIGHPGAIVPREVMPAGVMPVDVTPAGPGASDAP
jgi:2-dehydro-3-deoxygluconokinase